MGSSATTEPGQRPVGRRRVLQAIMGFSLVSTAAIVLTPIVGFLLPPKDSGAAAGGKVLAGTVDDIPLGSGKVVAMGSTPVMVVNTDQGVKAYEAICTHLGCIVAWDDGASNIVCPCHDGRFNPATGAVASGPPPAPLPPVEASVEGNEIYLVSG
jgi:cytochrome b6-f complex iron-sulfur subunit